MVNRNQDLHPGFGGYSGIDAICATDELFTGPFDSTPSTDSPPQSEAVPPEEATVVPDDKQAS